LVFLETIVVLDVYFRRPGLMIGPIFFFLISGCLHGLWEKLFSSTFEFGQWFSVVFRRQVLPPRIFSLVSQPPTIRDLRALSPPVSFTLPRFPLFLFWFPPPVHPPHTNLPSPAGILVFAVSSKPFFYSLGRPVPPF